MCQTYASSRSVKQHVSVIDEDESKMLSEVTKRRVIRQCALRALAVKCRKRGVLFFVSDMILICLG